MEWKHNLVIHFPSRRIVNMTQLFKAEGQAQQKLRSVLKRHTFWKEMMRTGDTRVQGTYLKYSDARRILQYHSMDTSLIDGTDPDLTCSSSPATACILGSERREEYLTGPQNNNESG